MIGLDPHGELGFRFGDAADLDGDGNEDLLVGSRRAGTDDEGEVLAWNESGTLLHVWPGHATGGLFGSSSIAVPDLDGDSQPDIVVSAPSAGEPSVYDGLVEAYRLDGERLWTTRGQIADGFGWHLAAAGDHDGDGIVDLWVGAPSNVERAHVYLVSGATGAVLDAIPSPFQNDAFGFFLASLDDLDGDDVPELAVGAPKAVVDGVTRGAVVVVSGRTRAVLRTLAGETAGTSFGLMVAPMDDVDGDEVPDIAVGAPGDSNPATPALAEVQVFSGATGLRLRRLASADRGDLYGRSLARLDDLDGDGVRDLAIGAPWWNGVDGRFEIRSGRSFALLGDIRGDEGGWLGWYVARAEGGLIVSSLHLDESRGAVDVYRVR